MSSQTSHMESSKTGRNWVQAIVRFREFGILVFIVLLIGAVSIRSPYFLTVDNFRDILLNISILIIVALAGVGLKCNIESLLKPGIRPILLGVATSAAVLVSSITTIGWILHL